MAIEDRVRNWIESYDRNGYLHGSILVAADNKILLSKGFGMANWEHKVPNHPETKFRIGSLSKAFTALGILQLHEKQKLTINDNIGKYLPDYPNGDQITIYHCLTNSTGIPNYTSFPDFWSQTMRLPSSLERLIDSFKRLPLNFEPGSQFEYSNSGYALLTAIIERVSNLSYAEYIQEHICRPLGMENTGCDDGMKVVPNLATGYSFWEEPIHSAYADLSFPLGAYGLYSTTEDLFMWDQALKSTKLLNNELMDLMVTPNHSAYACGWNVSKLLGKKCVHHFGDISGFFSDFLRFVEDQVTIIFLSNMNVSPVTHLTQELAKITFEEEVQFPVPANPVPIYNKESFVGRYFIKNDPLKTLDISIKNGDLYVTVPKMYGVLYKFKLVPVIHEPSSTTFITEMIHEQLLFRYSTSGEIESIEYVDYYGDKNRIVKEDE